MDKLRFQTACEKAANAEKAKSGIGTLGEKTLHAVLKHYFEDYEGSHEVKIGSFVADIVGENGIIEIQTGNFNRLRKKLDAFLQAAAVTVVYPVVETKWLIWIDKETGEITKKRKSPKKGKVYEVFRELYSIKQMLTHYNFRLCVVLLEVEEYRYLDGWSKDRKKGSSRSNRIPIDITGEIHIRNTSDYIKLVPGSLQGEFTAADYKKASGLSINDARTALNVLIHIGTVIRVGKQGNAFVYRLY